MRFNQTSLNLSVRIFLVVAVVTCFMLFLASTTFANHNWGGEKDDDPFGVDDNGSLCMTPDGDPWDIDDGGSDVPIEDGGWDDPQNKDFERWLLCSICFWIS